MKAQTLEDMKEFVAVTDEFVCYLLVEFPCGGLYVGKNGSAHWNTGGGRVTPATLRTLQTIAAALKSTRGIGE
jgi:hypothetical protein